MNETPNRPLVRIIRVEEAASWIDGFALLKRAEAEAAAIRAGAEREVEDARQTGREEGRKTGEAEAAALLARTHSEVDRYFASIEPLVAALAMDIVKRVIGSIDDGELVARVAHQALEAFREQNSIVVNVPFEHVTEVEQRLATFSSRRVRVVADRHLSGNQCTMTTPSTSIDLSIETQLDAIREAMAGSGRSQI